MAQIVPRLKSDVFKIEDMKFGGVTEQVVRGGRDKFALLPQALRNRKKIGVIGWGSQGPAHAQNLRESLAGTDIRVKVGLQKGSKSAAKARAAGFTEENGTLGEMFDVIRESDLVILLISDAAQVEHHEAIFEAIKPGAILGLAHGFLIGYLDSVGKKLPGHFGVVGNCPKGMGPSVRRLYEQGSGINASIAVEQEMWHDETDVAIGWAIAIGAPFTFMTTLRNEVYSDLSGERGVLLGGVHGMLEALFRERLQHYQQKPEDAFTATVEALTGPISKAISTGGLLGLANRFSGFAREEFFQAYLAAYSPYQTLMREIYEEVVCGNEVRSVVMAGPRLKQWPMSTIDNTLMWETGKKVRSGQRSTTLDVPQAITAGMYCAQMMAQIDLLLSYGHSPSEVCNESVIEAVDSLNPFMHARGVAYMVDNCSTTARLGTRKWGPRSAHTTMQEVLPAFHVNCESDSAIGSDLVTAFLSHPIHQALDVCRSMRPPVDIAVA